MPTVPKIMLGLCYDCSKCALRDGEWWCRAVHGTCRGAGGCAMFVQREGGAATSPEAVE